MDMISVFLNTQCGSAGHNWKCKVTLPETEEQFVQNDCPISYSRDKNMRNF